MPKDPYEQMHSMAERWFNKNVRKLFDWPYELGFGFFVDAQGKVGTTELSQGEEADVEWPEAPPGTVSIGSLHTHIGSDAALSPFDEEEGQKEANRTGRTYVLYVVGPSQMDEGYELNWEEFEPQATGSVAESVVQVLLEIGDAPPYAYKLVRKSSTVLEWNFETDEGMPYRVTAREEEGGYVRVDFGQMDQLPSQQFSTATVMRIYNTVFAIIKDIIERNKPRAFVFDSFDIRRANLVITLMKRHMPAYKALRKENFIVAYRPGAEGAGRIETEFPSKAKYAHPPEERVVMYRRPEGAAAERFA